MTTTSPTSPSARPTRTGGLPDALRRSAFTVATGRAAGLTPTQLRRASLRSPTHGVRSADPPRTRDDLHGRCRDLLPALPPDALFSHTTALALLGVAMPSGWDPEEPVHVQVGPGTSRVRRRGVVAHRRSSTDARRWTLAGGIPVVAPVVAWTQVGALMPRDELVVLGDALVRRRDPLSTTDAMAAEVDALPPRARGLIVLRAALPLVRAHTDSPMETRLRLLLVRDGLPCPVVNLLVRAPDGTVVAMPDLAYPREHIAIEYDGDVHRTDPATWRRDVARRQGLEALGWRVISCTADDVLRRPDRPAAWVRAALTRRP
jgi:hypothetical protein